MSSSRPSSRHRGEASAGSCPTCGSRRVRLVQEAVVLVVRGVRHRFPDVEHERCLACGERIFGFEASKRFDALFTRRRSRAA